MTGSDAEVSSRNGPVGEPDLVPNVVVELLDFLLAAFGKRTPSLADDAATLHPVRSVGNNPLSQNVHDTEYQSDIDIDPDDPAADRKPTTGHVASPSFKEDVATWIFIRARFGAVEGVFW